jgi:uncharacterized lipoprotein YddW (UPF0748 family)
MKNLFGIWLFCISIALALVACDNEDPIAASGERSITAFRFEAFNPVAEASRIDDQNGIIEITVPFGVPLTALAPTIEVSEGATVSPASGVAQDFSRFVIYAVTAANGARRNYTALVNVGPSNIAAINAFRFPDLFRVGTINQNEKTIRFQVPFGTQLDNLTATLQLAEAGSTVQPESGSAQNFSSPVTYTVTAPDGQTTETYTVSVEVLPQETGVRGIWVTNVDSDILTSRAKIQEAVDLLASLNFNTIFMVVYNKAATMYPSQVMEDLIGRRIDPIYGNRDPLREMIDIAHEKNIKVIAWFEYGFAAFNPSPGPILQAFPEWASIASNGQPVVKNGFHWLNALKPEVQNFMTDLVLEVVRNYPDIDGVQGDDRLPAMPTEGGYDAFTVAEYRSEHGGANPPTDFRDDNWVQWRANRMNAYGKSLYDAVKAVNPNCLVTWSPSPMTFGLREYLQDYPAWVQGGYSDMISPQLYRRDSQGLGVYRGLLEDQLNLVGRQHLNSFYPGILSFLGGYRPDPEYLVNVIAENRRQGVTGEVHFFYNAVVASPAVFQSIYPGPAIFPDLGN